MRHTYRPRASSRGMALLVSLVILLSLTLLGLAAIQNTTLEERMAGNTRAENIALQAAESALRAGEAWIIGRNIQPRPVSCVDVVPVDEVSVCIWESADPDWSEDVDVWPGSDDKYAWWEQRPPSWWNAARVASDELPFWATGGDESELKSISEDRLAHYVIEERGPVRQGLTVGQQQDLPNEMSYQLTARGLDDAGRGEAIVRSTITRPF